MSDVKIEWSEADDRRARLNAYKSVSDYRNGGTAERERAIEIVREVCESRHIPDWDKPDEIVSRIAQGRKE